MRIFTTALFLCALFSGRAYAQGALAEASSAREVAAYPVTGPIDVIGAAPVGVLDDDLGKAALAALNVSRTQCRTYAEGFSWARSTDAFLEHLPVIARANT